jgi:hypothetical protein
LFLRVEHGRKAKTPNCIELKSANRSRGFKSDVLSF